MISSSRKPVVLDTNVVFSGLALKSGIPFSIREHWRSGAFDLVISAALVQEYREVLMRPAFVSRYDPTQAASRMFFTDLLNRAFVSAPVTSLPVSCRDPKDVKLLATALGFPTSYLVTGDNDLLSLAHEEGLGSLRIVSPRAFLDILIGEC